MLVWVNVQKTQVEEGEKVDVYFHPHYHHLKKETRVGSITKEFIIEYGTITKARFQAKDGININQVHGPRDLNKTSHIS